MSTRRLSVQAATVVLIVGGSAACDSGPTQPSAGDDAALVATIATTALAMRPSLAGNGPFEQACPASGRMIVEGMLSSEQQGELFVQTWDVAHRYEDCGFTLASGNVTVNGEMQLTGEAHFGPVMGQQAPLVMQQSRQVGSMTMMRVDETRSCDYDLSHTFDAEQNSYRITGTACGRTVDLRAPSTP